MVNVSKINASVLVVWLREVHNAHNIMHRSAPAVMKLVAMSRMEIFVNTRSALARMGWLHLEHSAQVRVNLTVFLAMRAIP